MKTHIASWASGIDQDGLLWLSHFGLNSLFCYDVNQNSMSFIDVFEKMKPNQIEMHYSLRITDEYIYFLPLRDKYLRRLNRQTRNLETVSLPHVDEDDRGFVEITNKSIIYITRAGKAFTADEENGIFSRDIWIEKIINDFVKELEAIPCEGSFYKDKEYYIDYQNGRIVLLYREKLCAINLEKHDAKFINLEDNKAFRVFWHDDEVWITHYYDFNIGNYNTKTGMYSCYSGENVEWKEIPEIDKMRPYSNLCFIDDDVFIPNYRAKNIYRINKRNNLIELAFVPKIGYPTKWSRDGLYPDYVNGLVFGRKVIFVPCGMSTMIEYNYDENEWSELLFEMDSMDKNQIKKIMDLSKIGEVIYEDSEVFSLESLIYYLEQ